MNASDSQTAQATELSGPLKLQCWALNSNNAIWHQQKIPSHNMVFTKRILQQFMPYSMTYIQHDIHTLWLAESHTVKVTATVTMDLSLGNDVDTENIFFSTRGKLKTLHNKFHKSYWKQKERFTTVVTTLISTPMIYDSCHHKYRYSIDLWHLPSHWPVLQQLKTDVLYLCTCSNTSRMEVAKTYTESTL